MQAGTRSDPSKAGPKMLPDKRKTPPRDAVLSIGDGLREIVSALRTETERAKEEHNVVVSKTPVSDIATTNTQLEIEKLQLEREKEKTKQLQLQVQLASLKATQ
jgi:hypothetical protein